MGAPVEQVGKMGHEQGVGRQAGWDVVSPKGCDLVLNQLCTRRRSWKVLFPVLC